MLWVQTCLLCIIPVILGKDYCLRFIRGRCTERCNVTERIWGRRGYPYCRRREQWCCRHTWLPVTTITTSTVTSATLCSRYVRGTCKSRCDLEEISWGQFGYPYCNSRRHRCCRRQTLVVTSSSTTTVVTFPTSTVFTSREPTSLSTHKTPLTLCTRYVRGTCKSRCDVEEFSWGQFGYPYCNSRRHRCCRRQTPVVTSSSTTAVVTSPTSTIFTSREPTSLSTHRTPLTLCTRYVRGTCKSRCDVQEISWGQFGYPYCNSRRHRCCRRQTSVMTSSPTQTTVLTRRTTAVTSPSTSTPSSLCSRHIQGTCQESCLPTDSVWGRPGYPYCIRPGHVCCFTGNTLATSTTATSLTTLCSRYVQGTCKQTCAADDHVWGRPGYPYCNRPSQQCCINRGSTPRPTTDKPHKDCSLPPKPSDVSTACHLPWVVSIFEFSSSHDLYCSGVLISTAAILTSKSCAQSMTSNSEARFSDYDLVFEDEQQQSRPLDPNTFKLHDNADLAVIPFSPPLFTSGCIRPLCLPVASTKFNPSRCKTAGWGVEGTEGSGATSWVLDSSDVQLMSLQDCENKLQTSAVNVRVNDDDICTTTNNSVAAMCHGDLGGVLLCQEESTVNDWRLAGVVRSTHCDVSLSNVFVNVSVYADWINQQISHP